MSKIKLRDKEKLFIYLDSYYAAGGIFTHFKKEGLNHDLITERKTPKGHGIIIDFETPETRLKMEPILERIGFMVNKEYNVGHSATEVLIKD